MYLVVIYVYGELEIVSQLKVAWFSWVESDRAL